MKRGVMKQSLFVSSLLLTTVGLGSVAGAMNQGERRGGESIRVGTAEQPPQRYQSRTEGLLAGVLEPLFSLQIMQHALASSPEPAVDDVPALALLRSSVKTTGLGPVQVGMTLEEVAAVGIALVPLDPRVTGTVCQYYRVRDSSEPLGFMAVEGKVIRVDVWPGSLVATRSGIAIGSTEADIYTQYPGRIEATRNVDTRGNTLTFTPEDPGEDVYRLVFETDAAGQVTQYRAGQFPAVTWPNGCL